MLKARLMLLLLLAASVSVAASESVVYGWKVTTVGNVVLTTPYRINCVWLPNNDLVKRCEVVLDVNNTGNNVNVNKNTIGLISRAFNATNLFVQRSTTYSTYVENYSINSTNSVNVTRRKFSNWLNASNTVSLQRGVTGIKINFFLPKYSAGLFNATVGSFVVDPEVTECGMINSGGYYWLTQNISLGENCIYFQDDTASNIDFNCDGYSIIFGNGAAFISAGDASQSNNTIRNCVLDCSFYLPDKPCADGKGVSAYGAVDWNVTNNTILMYYGDDVTGLPQNNYGIHFHDGGNGGWVTNNVVDLTNSTGSFLAYFEGQYLNITNNVFNGSDSGIVTSANSLFAFNTVFNVTGYAIQINGENNVSYNDFSDCGVGVFTSGNLNVVQNNVVNNTSAECIWLNSGNNNTVVGNNVSYCGALIAAPATAINLVSADYANASFNRVSDSSSGFVLDGNSDYALINGNVVEDESTMCVEVGGDNSVVSNNYCNNVFYGFQTTGGSANNLFANNTLVGDYNGIGLVVSEGNVTFYNNSVSVFQYGAYVYNAYNNAWFVNCNTTRNKYDVYIAGLNSNLSFQNHSFQNVSANFTGYRVWLNSTLSKPSDPATFYNLGKYVNATNHTANGWLLLNVSYSTADVSGLNEASLRVARYNASWNTDASSFASSYGVDAANNYVYANVTKFTATNALFAVLGQAAATGWSHSIYWISNANIGKIYWIAKANIAKVYGVS